LRNAGSRQIAACFFPIKRNIFSSQAFEGAGTLLIVISISIRKHYLGRIMKPPDDIVSRINFHVEYGNYGEALILLRNLLGEDPDNPDILCKIALCLLKVGEKNEAREFAEKALAMNPEHRKAKILIQQWNKEPAEKNEIAIKRNSSTAPFFDMGADSELKPLPKKICPNCQSKVMDTAWRCGYCGQFFMETIRKKVVLYASVFLF